MHPDGFPTSASSRPARSGDRRGGARLAQVDPCCF